MSNYMNVKVVRGISSFGPVWGVFRIRGTRFPIFVASTMAEVNIFITSFNYKVVEWQDVTTDDMEV